MAHTRSVCQNYSQGPEPRTKVRVSKAAEATSIQPWGSAGRPSRRQATPQYWACFGCQRACTIGRACANERARREAVGDTR